MNSKKQKSVAKSRPKLNATTIIAVFLLIFLSFNRTKSDELCEAIIVDAITQIANGSIVIFRNKDVWILDQIQKQLIGPCPISSVFKDMSGPVDAALTIGINEKIAEFIGSSLYFENKNYYTFKNLGQYQVEWGSIVHLSHKGDQKDMGKTEETANKYMKETISYAFFDPIDLKSKFVFSDGTVLSFPFEFPAEYDIPEISTIKEELNKYGLELIPKFLTAAFTITKNKSSELFLFNGSTFCSIKISGKPGKQSCQLIPIKEFLNCDSIKRSNDICLGDTNVESHEKPVTAEKFKSDSVVVVVTQNNEIPESKVRIRSNDQPSVVKPEKSAVNCSHFLVLNWFVFALIFIRFYSFRLDLN